MSNFKTVNPSDNPQPGDANYAGPYPRKNAEGKDVMPGSPGYDDLEMSDAEKQAMVSHAGGPGPRYGLQGVDKPHGGGTMGLEAEAAARRPFDQNRLPAGNPNNPSDRNNPDGTDARAARAQQAQEGNTGVSMAADDAANLKDTQRQQALAGSGVDQDHGRPSGDKSAPQSGVYDPKAGDETPSLANEQRDKNRHADQDKSDPSRKDDKRD